MSTTNNTTSDSFLGTGWAFPPTFRSQGTSVEMLSDEDDVLQSIQILISTSMDERVMHPIFGCNLQEYVFSEIDHKMKTGVKSIISDAILRYETRITLNEVTVEQDQDNLGILHIGVEYTINTTNSRKNIVFPFYVNEATG